MDECAGCIYWDGDDGMCRNPNSQYFMSFTDNGCSKWQDEDAPENQIHDEMRY